MIIVPNIAKGKLYVKNSNSEIEDTNRFVHLNTTSIATNSYVWEARTHVGGPEGLPLPEKAVIKYKWTSAECERELAAYRVFEQK